MKNTITLILIALALNCAGQNSKRGHYITGGSFVVAGAAMFGQAIYLSQEKKKFLDAGGEFRNGRDLYKNRIIFANFTGGVFTLMGALNFMSTIETKNKKVSGTVSENGIGLRVRF